MADQGGGTTARRVVKRGFTAYISQRRTSERREGWMGKREWKAEREIEREGASLLTGGVDLS